MNDIVKKINSYLKKNDNYLISSHVSADGDALASMLAVSLLLDKLNKTYRIVLHDDYIDIRYSFLKNWSKIESLKDVDKKQLIDQTENLIITDAPGTHRLGDIADVLSPDWDYIKIDHHPAEDNNNGLGWVDTYKSSAAAMVYHLVKNSTIAIDKDIAEAIYSGIIYDTGRLSFSNTTAEDLEICAELVRCGVKPAEITQRIFFNNVPQALRVIGAGLIKIQQFIDGKVTAIILDHKDIDGVEQADIEELANYSVSIRGSEVGLYIREIKPDFYKISLRSRGSVDVRTIAQSLDGGGHIKAAGCRFEGNLADLLDKLINLISKQV